MKKARGIICSSLSLTRLILSLFGLWITFGWKVRKARKAFEKELVHQGMSKENAKRLSTQYTKLKNDMVRSIKDSLLRNH